MRTQGGFSSFEMAGLMVVVVAIVVAGMVICPDAARTMSSEEISEQMLHLTEAAAPEVACFEVVGEPVPIQSSAELVMLPACKVAGDKPSGTLFSIVAAAGSHKLGERLLVRRATIAAGANGTSVNQSFLYVSGLAPQKAETK